MMNTIIVGISELNVTKNGGVLVTYALGSCVGICLYDKVHKVAGMAHIMLPNSAAFSPTGDKVYKFADLAIPLLVQRMEAVGGKQICMKAKIAGGAQMFASINNSSLANIGANNTLAVKQILQDMRIPLVAEDTGKNYGRTQFLDSADGTMRIKSAIKGEWIY